MATDLDKIINDLLEIFAALDGRVKRLELKLQIKKRPSYLKVVEQQEGTNVTDEIRTEQALVAIQSLTKAVNELSARIDELEK